MADETTSTSAASTSEPSTESKAGTSAAESTAATPTATEAPAVSPAAAGQGAGPEGGPVAGDPTSEPVATAEQSHVAGRVGPPTIQQDEAAPWHTGEGVTTVAPGSVQDAAMPREGGAVAYAVPDPQTFGAGPYGGDTPADEAPNVVHQTKPGTEPAGPDELPAGTPEASAAAARRARVGAEGGTPTTVTASDPDAPASPTGSASSPSEPGSVDDAGPADLESSGGSDSGPAETAKRSDSADSAGSTSSKSTS